MDDALRFHAERADLHDRAAGRAASHAGDFDALATRIGPGSRVVVPVSRYNFHRLPKVVAGLAQRLGIDSPEVDAFSPIPLAGSGARYGEYLDRVRAVLAGGPLAIEAQPDVPAILSILEAALPAEGENPLLRVLGILAETAFIGPEVFHLDVANACNLSCLYCGFHSPYYRQWRDPEWERRRLDWELFTRVADDLAAMRAFEHVAVCGEGEPTTHPRLLDMLAYLAERGLTTVLYTNGLLLTPERVERLVAMRTGVVLVTVSGATRATYEALHPEQAAGDYDALLASLRLLVDLRRARGADRPRLVVKHVIARGNYHELIDMTRQARDLGADELMFELMHRTGHRSDELVLTPREVRELKGLLRGAEILAGKWGVNLTSHLAVQLATIDPETSRWSGGLYESRGCFAGWFFGRLYTDRAVSFCCQGKILGDLTDGSFASLWFSDAYDAIRRKAKVFDPADNHAFERGGPLIAPGCSACGNYFTNEQYHRRIERLGLTPYLAP
jgi:MoaA/NifB/PqqE/SkfB family radical SAM enzyme